ncbi:MAG TPA: hypothetical protein VGB14_13885 [Acidimicrobiales bacterium]
MPLPPGPPHPPARPLRVVAWIDPALHHGFGLQHPYVEVAWTPVLGPTAVLAARRLDLLLGRHPDGVDIDVADLAAQLGVGARGTGGKWSPIVRSLERLERFGFARWDPHTDRFHLRTAVPALPRQLLDRLPATVVDEHHALLRRHLRHLGDRPPVSERAGVDSGPSDTSPGSPAPLDPRAHRLRALPGGGASRQPRVR